MKDKEKIVFQQRIDFQNQYIRMLEAEIFHRLSKKELDIYRREHDSDFSVFTCLKIESYEDLYDEISEKLFLTQNQTPENPLLFDITHIPPPHYTIPKRCEISFNKSDEFRNCVILKYFQGKRNLVCSLYLDESMPLTMDIMGHLIDLFFQKVCQNRIDMIKGKTCHK